MGLLADITNGDIGASLSDVTADLQQYIVAPSAAFGLAGYIFNAQGENINHLSADITDHYAEDNTAIQDQIAIKPKRITIKGYVGEVIYQGNSNGILNTTENVLQKLTEVSAFLPVLSSAATQIQNAAIPPITFDNILNASSDVYSIVKNLLGATGDMKNQQNAYSYFAALMNSKTLLSLQTPWEFIANLAIETITATQDEKSRFITDFSITLKQIRFSQTTAVSGGTLSGTGTNPSVATNSLTGIITGQGANAIQIAPPSINGPLTGVVSDVTDLFKTASGFATN